MNINQSSSSFGLTGIPPPPSHYIHPSNLQSVLRQEAVFPFNFQSLLRVASPALPSISQAYDVAVKASPHPILSVTLQPHCGNPVTLPYWIFTYWRIVPLLAQAVNNMTNLKSRVPLSLFQNVASKSNHTGGKGLWKQVGTCQEH